MKIAGYDIKPISLYLPDDPEWIARDNRAREYFEQQGIIDTLWIAGIHAQKWGIQGRHIYLLDGRPEEQFYFGDKNVGCFLSCYVVYSVMNVLPDSHFLFMETDCNFDEGWKEKLEQALIDIPRDFDFLFIGSCCAEDKNPIRVREGSNVFHFPYLGKEKWDWMPQCGHCMIIAKKCIPHLIATNRDVANPIDISLIRYSFPELKVFAILPRLARQAEQTILPR